MSARTQHRLRSSRLGNCRSSGPRGHRGRPENARRPHDLRYGGPARFRVPGSWTATLGRHREMPDQRPEVRGGGRRNYLPWERLRRLPHAHGNGPLASRDRSRGRWRPRCRACFRIDWMGGSPCDFRVCEHTGLHPRSRQSSNRSACLRSGDSVRVHGRIRLRARRRGRVRDSTSTHCGAHQRGQARMGALRGGSHTSRGTPAVP